MDAHEVVEDINTNPMVFEEIATSLATLGSFARGDVGEPIERMEHLYRRALQSPPNYEEITSITGHNMATHDRECGRAAWLLLNIEGLDIQGVHTLVWHKVDRKYSAPILEQIARATGRTCALSKEDFQKLGSDNATIDVVALKGDAICLVQVVTRKDVAESALNRPPKNGQLFRSQVYVNATIEGKELSGLVAAEKQMRLAFPDAELRTMVLVVHPKLPDFELYQIELPQRTPTKLLLEPHTIRRNSIDVADDLRDDPDALYTLPQPLDNELFKGMPPCRGGRTMNMLAAAATRQMQSDLLLTWERKHFIKIMVDDFGVGVETDKIRHDLDDRLVAQGFFRKRGRAYYVSPRGIARYQYCLAKFTAVGNAEFDLDQLIAQRDKIIAKYGCVA
jgi:hypothetical protein